MADFDSSLPTSITDHVDPDGTDKQTEVSEKLFHVRAHGEDPGGTKRQLKVSESGKANEDGEYNATTNSEPASSGIIAHSRNATHDETKQDKRPTAVDGESDSVCLDVAFHDSDGNNIDLANPLPVFVGNNPGDEVIAFGTNSSLAKDAFTNHDYTVTAAKTFVGKRIWISASGKLKAELQTEDGVGAGTFTTKYVGFSSTANPNINIPLDDLFSQIALAKVRVIVTNLDNKTMSIYCSIAGIES